MAKKVPHSAYPTFMPDGTLERVTIYAHVPSMVDDDGDDSTPAEIVQGARDDNPVMLSATSHPDLTVPLGNRTITVAQWIAITNALFGAVVDGAMAARREARQQQRLAAEKLAQDTAARASEGSAA